MYDVPFSSSGFEDGSSIVVDEQFSDGACASRRPTNWPWIVRLPIVVGVWLPFFAAVFFFVPQFGPVFCKLAEKDELPWSTWLLWKMGKLNIVMSGLLTLAFFVVLLVFDMIVAKTACIGGHGGLKYEIWVSSVVLLALLAFTAVFVAIGCVTL